MARKHGDASQPRFPKTPWMTLQQGTQHIFNLTPLLLLGYCGVCYSCKKERAERMWCQSKERVKAMVAEMQPLPTRVEEEVPMNPGPKKLHVKPAGGIAARKLALEAAELAKFSLSGHQGGNPSGAGAASKMKARKNWWRHKAGCFARKPCPCRWKPRN
eukprot:5641301-Amphidinium_carterae.1